MRILEGMMAGKIVLESVSRSIDSDKAKLLRSLKKYTDSDQSE